ncbi:hypothetical protein BO70DRAFT_371406 [Aspergillus heteromorphus CBS 117.55]|uniref:AAA+ ATPase domain-containing protein n=1 Tax=Aspergillus heteromorphus CBS 117.55 TaxID=1448321 RepID=A0A317W5H4_9EURO|nr:uncharacterized protein BO70DRAFT_371406 [Aspergillus heteromorphus CBS 117.55]PWY80477.1 hypothetical protein BO70DRAFT_371406 [Aspergillus heteromorphus CBS 117.55]
MDCSMTRPSTTARFPFFPFSLWSKRPQQSISTQTPAPTPAQTVPSPVMAQTQPQPQTQTQPSSRPSSQREAERQPEPEPEPEPEVHIQPEPQPQSQPQPEPEIPRQVTPPQPTPEELAERDHQSRETAREEAISELDGLVGHDNVKRQLHGVQTWVQICRRHGRDPKGEWYNIAFLGQAGTGKTTVARIYAKLLYAMGICDAHTVCETTGADLVSRGPDGVQQLLRGMTDDPQGALQTAGVLIVDHPHPLLETPQTPAVEQALDDIRQVMERHTGRIIVVFTGEVDEVTLFLRENPQLQQRICSSLRFNDFDRPQLVQLLARRIITDYNGRMQVEGGLEGPYMQAAARRLVRGRAAKGSKGFKGFANAHAVREMVKSIAQRQALCLTDQQDGGMDEVDYFFFSKDDVLGPSPGEIRSESQAWAAMQQLIGQDAVKASVAEVFDTAEENYHREIRNQRRLPLRINRIFAGPPGTGKATAIRMYAQILVDLGLLSGGEVRAKPLSALCDLSEEQLHATIDSTAGHVLVVDVDSDRQERPTVPDTVLDRLAAPRDDQCTILVGTHDSISQFLYRAGPRARVFETQLVRFAALTREHMEELFQSKLDEQELDATPEAFQAAMDTLDNARMRRDFDNARALDHLLAAAIYHFERRSRTTGVPSAPPVERLLEGRDFNPELVGGTTALVFREELRHSIVPDDIISILKRYHNEMKAAWMQGLDPGQRMPSAFIFKGAPGTGKKTVARQLGTLYYKMGALTDGALVPCSVADLLAPQAYPTSVRSRSQLDCGRGKVLFVEDAHRLMENESATQAVDELVYLLPRYAPEMVVILAGPAQEMDQLLANRPRLAALFQEEIVFRNPTPRECLRLLDRKLTEQRVQGPRLYLTDPRTPSHREFTRAIQILSMFPCWSNARDVEVLARWMVSACVRELPLEASAGGALPAMQLSDEQAMSCMVRLFNLKRDRLRFNQDPKARALPRALSQPRVTERTGVKFPV